MKRALLGLIGLLWIGCGAGDGGSNNYDAGVIDAAPHPVCGNDVTEYAEACDGADLSGYTCDTLAAQLTSGTLACKSDCSGFDVSGCGADGQTIAALSCDQADVQAAVDGAGDGDTVVVPAGHCTWTTPADCDGRIACAGVHLPGTSLTLQGAGAGNTIIESDIPEGWAHATVFADTQEGKPVRITGFSFTEILAPAVSIAGPDRSFRVDHCHVTPRTDNWVVAVSVVSRAVGVVDHCTLADSEVIVLPDEDDAWDRPLTLGTANGVYVEDCTFTNSGAINDGVDVDFTVQDDTHPEMADYIQQGRDFYNDSVTYDATTGCYDTSFIADNGDLVHLRYKPYVYPHPLVQVAADLP